MQNAARRWAHRPRIATAVFDAKTQFGAKGNGSADETEAIQAAIDAARNQGAGAMAYVPVGNYRITRALQLGAGDYLFGSSLGWRSTLTWVGDGNQAILQSDNANCVTIRQLRFAASREMDVTSLLVTANQAGRLVCDGIYGGGGHQPRFNGLALSGLPAGFIVYAPHVNGEMTIRDCGEASILIEDYYTDYQGPLTIRGGGDGFLGINSMVSSNCEPDMRVWDGASLVVADFYSEQTQGHIVATGKAGQKPGRVTISAGKQHGVETKLTIDNYVGPVTLSRAKWESPCTITGKSTGNCMLLLLGNVATPDPLTCDLQGVKRVQLADLVWNKATLIDDQMPDSPLDKTAVDAANAAFDHWRELSQAKLTSFWPNLKGCSGLSHIHGGFPGGAGPGRYSADIFFFKINRVVLGCLGRYIRLTESITKRSSMDREWDTCFDIVDVPSTPDTCDAILAELALALDGLLHPVRFEDMRGTLAAWDRLTAAEQLTFRQSMGWRRAMFLDDSWLWPLLRLPAELGEEPDRQALHTWATCVSRHWPGAQEKAINAGLLKHYGDGDTLLERAEQTLQMDFSPSWAPTLWRNDGPIDWHPGDADNNWVTHVYRLLPLELLAYAWRETGDRRFLGGMPPILADLTWELPGNVICQVGTGKLRTHWGVDALDVAIRTVKLLNVYAAVAPELPADFTMLVWKTLYFCGARGHEFSHTRCHNIVFFEAQALGEVGFLAPVFRAADEWREAAQTRMLKVMRGAFQADGSNVEGALGYHPSYVRTPQELLRAARETGLPLLPAYEAEVLARGRRAVAFWASLVSPVGIIPPLGDCARYDARPQLREAATAYEADAWQIDLANQRPAFTSIYHPVQRLAIMRGSWEPDAAYAICSLRGYHAGHDNRDVFHYEVHGGDTPFLVDTGCLDYDKNRPRSQATRSHNTLVVDERDQLPGAAVDIRWHTHETFDWIEGLGLGHPAVSHRRAICFLKPDTFVVLDRVQPLADQEHHHFAFHHHFDLDLQVQLNGQAVVATHENGRRLHLSFLAEDGWHVQETKGDVSEGYGQWRPAPVVIQSFQGKAGFGMVAVLQVNQATSAPWRAIRQPPVWLDAGSGQTLKGGEGLGLLLERPGKRVVLMWNEPGTGEKCLGDWTANGELLIGFEQEGVPVSAWSRTASIVTCRDQPVEYTHLFNQSDRLPLEPN